MAAATAVDSMPLSRKEIEVKTCLIGRAGSGKTCLSRRFAHDEFSSESAATVGASFLTKSFEFNNKKCLFQLWDTAGQEKYRSVTSLYYRNAAVVIIVYDITDKESFDDLQTWYNDVRDNVSDKFVTAVVGAKLDMAEKRQVPTEDGAAYAESIGALFFETSSVTGQNVTHLFEGIVLALPGDSATDNKPRAESVVLALTGKKARRPTNLWGLC